MRFSIPAWVKELVDQVNQTGGDGFPGLLRHFSVFNRLGQLVDRDGFLTDLNALIDHHEAQVAEQATAADRLLSLRPPNLMTKTWREDLHSWMQTVMDAFLGFHVEIPEPPMLNRSQRRSLVKYGFRLFFVPAIEENQYPKHMVKPNWGKYLAVAQIERVPLPGKWVAIETIGKPNYQDGKYPDDKLMADTGIASRFNHPVSDKGEGDDIVLDFLPKVAKILGPLPGGIQLPTVEIWNFIANLFLWLNSHCGEKLPDLGATSSVEWCANRYDSRDALFVGDSYGGSLAYVHWLWRDDRDVRIAFRFLAVF
ncbi:MAG: hypothetical protein WC654_00465 [Patescibacteria group bacterium]